MDRRVAPRMKYDNPLWESIEHEEVLKWSPEDLDRCEHGQHSTDSCFDCPEGLSTGNMFLYAPWEIPAVLRRRRHLDRKYEVRIGTRVHGEPIWVTVRDSPR
jgi:hypothetical protein